MTIDDLKKEARQRWGRVTAFRLGLLAGKYQLDIANPYAETRGERPFEQGRDDGAKMRWSDQA